MKKHSFFKQTVSVAALTTLFIGFVLPFGTAIAEEDELYKLYYDQAKEYEGSDLGLILESGAKILQMTGTHASCPNFTRYVGKSFESVEDFTVKFKEMMTLVTDECMSYVNKNMSLVGAEFYGHGQIFDWLNVAYVAIKNNPDVQFIDFNAPQEEAEKIEEDIAEEVAIVEEIEVIEEVKVVEEIKTVEEPTKAPEEEKIIVDEVKPPAGDITETAVGTETTVSAETEKTPQIEAGTETETTVSEPTTIETTVTEETRSTDAEEKRFAKTEEDKNKNGLPDFFEEIFEIPASTNDAELDSDGDGLSNTKEYILGTDPMRSDSDGDGISDNEEISIGTDPTDEDTDNDLIPDNEEISAGTDPLSADSDNNGISDLAQLRTDVTADTVTQNGFQDSDGDGLSDAYEILKGTDINNANSIDGTLSDNEVALDYRNFRNEQKDKSALIRSTVKARIVNIKSGEVLVDQKPIFKGTAPEGAIIIFYYKDAATGVGLELGEVISDGGNKFIFQPAVNMPIGTHTLFARIYNKEGIAIDYIKSIDITIAVPISEVDIANTEAPSVASINEVQIEEILEAVKEETIEKKEQSATERKAKLDKLKLQYEKGRKSTIRGYAVPGSIVEVYWQSLIISSAVIADAETGYYEASPSGELEPGDHTAWLYSVDPKTNAKSKSSKVEFEIGDSTKVALLTPEGNGGVTLLIIGLLAFLGLGGFLLLRKKKHSLTPLS